MSADVLARNACANCRRPIAKLSGVGWVHEEIAKYAHEEPGCGLPVPVDPRCAACGQYVPAEAVRGGAKLAHHDAFGAVRCVGSGRVQEWTT